jgi:hypothetical protein
MFPFPKVVVFELTSISVIPLSMQQLNYIHEIDPTAEANGLSQALPASEIWSRGSRNRKYAY